MSWPHNAPGLFKEQRRRGRSAWSAAASACGDLAKLTDEQLEQVMAYFEKLIPPERLAEAKRRAMIEAGQAGPIVDVTCSPAAPEDEKELW
jgi:hypothetical protein